MSLFWQGGEAEREWRMTISFSVTVSGTHLAWGREAGFRQ